MSENKPQKIVIIILSGVIVYLILGFILLFIAVNDTKGSYKWELHQSINDIKRICIVDAKNEIEYEIIKEISIERLDEFVNGYSNITYEYQKNTRSGHSSGIGFLIMYIDDSYDIITASTPYYCIIQEEKAIPWIYGNYNHANEYFGMLLIEFLQ